MDLESYKEKAVQKHSEQLATLKRLKNKPPKNLDYIMQELHDEVFAETDCLSCANCCKTTGPLFTRKDIDRISKKLRIKPQAFIQQYLRIDEENDYVLQKLPCPFLGGENYCMIYEDRPKACKEFPHTDRKKFYQINSLTIKNCKICPATFEVVDRLKDMI